MKVAVVGGGTSPEAEVSRVSATQVVEGLRDGHDAIYIEYDEDFPTRLYEMKPDVVFPVLHGVPGEDGTIQAFLEVSNLPFVGSGMSASALAIDKYLAKCVWREHGLPLLPMKLLAKDSWSPSVAKDLVGELGSAVALKPRAQGSALGVRLLPNGGDVNTVIQESLCSHEQVLVEPFIHGREITVGVLEQQGVTDALPILEIQVLADGEWYDYTNRYKAGASRHVLNPEMKTSTADDLKKHAIAAHKSLGCRDFSRADFILDADENPWLLEINTIPGMTPTSLFPDAAKGAGIDFSSLVSLLVDNAVRRGASAASTAS